MSAPAFPTLRTYSSSYGGKYEKLVEGISERRLLAGMILNGIVAGLFANPNNIGWTPEGNVKAAVQYADELIKQTEET